MHSALYNQRSIEEGLPPIFHCVHVLVAPPSVQYVIVDAQVWSLCCDNDVTQARVYLRELSMIAVMEIVIFE